MIKAVIFDVDGTLIDSVDQHARAWQDALVEFGHDVPFDRIRSQIGKGGDQLMPVFLSDEQIERVGDALQERRGEILKQRYLPTIKAFPDARALFERLREHGVLRVLASSAKSEELQTYKKLAQIENLVDIETSSDDASKSKPHPDIFQAAMHRLGDVTPAEVMVVGDTPYDVDAARRAGLRTVGVLCGGFPEADLRDAGAVAIYRDPADLLAGFDNSPLR